MPGDVSGRAERRPRPEIVTVVRATPGRYRKRVDMTGPGSESTVLPPVSERGRVRVGVGLGLRPEDLAQTVAAARQLRHVATLEIFGQTRKAVEDAARIFHAAWDILDRQDVPGGDEETAGAWLALMVAMHVREAVEPAPRPWDGRRFGDFRIGGGT